MRKSMIALSVVGLAILYMSMFIINEGQCGIVLRFGKVLRDNTNKSKLYLPGLHFKFPLIEKVKSLDARIQTVDNKADHFITKDKKDLILDSYIKWRVSDFGSYYLATGGGNISQAEIILKRKFSDRLSSEIGSLEVKDIITDPSGILTKNVQNSLNIGINDKLDKPKDNDTLSMTDRKMISNTDIISSNQQLLNANSMAALGILVLDVRIKKITLPPVLSNIVYNSIRAKCTEAANKQRLEGIEESEKLRAKADFQVEKKLSEAQHQALIIRGEGDSQAIQILANAFSQNPDFYVFIRSLRAYEKSFHRTDLFVLNMDNDLFRFMKSIH